MRILLFDAVDSVVSAFREEPGLAAFEVIRVEMSELRGVAAVVSPANSFGFMDGGIDDVMELRWPGIQARVQLEIESDWHGELPVGCAFAVETLDKGITHLICAPTMRVPMELPEGTINPYLAARAAVLAARRAGLDSLAIPGLGTGAGGLPAAESARQIGIGIRDALRPPKRWASWQSAVSEHKRVQGAWAV